MTVTVRRRASELRKDWHVVDAAGRPLGRVASEVAILLRGKHKPDFEPHLDGGDFVIIVNAGKVRLSGRKAGQKVYYRHSGYPGNLRRRTFAEQMARRPELVLERAVRGMLPKGPLGKRLRRHLKVYPGPDHPHAAQVTGSLRAREAAAGREAEALRERIANPPKPPLLRPLSVPHAPVPRPTRREKVAAWLAELEEARAAAEADAEAMAAAEADALADDDVTMDADATAEATTAEAEADAPADDDATMDADAAAEATTAEAEADAPADDDATMDAEVDAPVGDDATMDADAAAEAATAEVEAPAPAGDDASAEEDDTGNGER